MKVLVKLGGTLVDAPEDRGQIAQQIAALGNEQELVVVHGGGKQVTRFLDERGIESRFINGLRVSDQQVIDAVVSVIAGRVNKQLVATLAAAGVNSVGISGVDGALTTAEQLAPELGWVGRPQASNAHLLVTLRAAGYLPVVACVAGDGRGAIFNVNADQMAVSCATGWKADRLLYLTDVPGVKDAAGKLLSHLTVSDARELVRIGVAHGGMQAKLEAAIAALHSGVREVCIAPGREPGILEQLLSGRPAGTRLVAA